MYQDESKAHLGFLEICQYFYPSQSVSQSVCLFVCTSVHPYVRLSLCLSVCQSLCLSVCLSVYMSVRPSVCLSVRLSVRPSVRLSVCLYIYISLCISLSCVKTLHLIAWFKLHGSVGAPSGPRTCHVSHPSSSPASEAGDQSSPPETGQPE